MTDMSVVDDDKRDSPLSATLICDAYFHFFDECQCTFPREPGIPPWLLDRHYGTVSAQPGNRNEACPQQRQEMESSSGAGALAEQAAPMPENPYTTHDSSGMTAGDVSAEHTADTNAAHQRALLDLTNAAPYMDHSQSSNAREDAEESSRPDSEAALAANILANGNFHVRNDETAQQFDHPTNYNAHPQINQSLFQENSCSNQDLQSRALDPNADPRNATAYAKLVFADGDYFITTHDVMLGRNMDMFEQMKRKKKQEKKAREQLENYRQEPSQPSQPGDEDQRGNPSSSSQSLEGRPAPPSTYSEHGGAISYPAHSDGEVEMQRAKLKRRNTQFSKSSSTTSVAPASLHPSSISYVGVYGDDEPEYRTYASIPIHTQVPEDISKISKEHLMFGFNFHHARWELTIVGNRAFVNEQLFEKGNVIPLEHNDEIMIASVHMIFKLPDNFRRSPGGLSRGTFSRASDDEQDFEDEESDDDEAISTSPVRRLSNAIDIDDSDDEEEEEERIEQTGGRKKPKLKLKTQPSKGRQKIVKGKIKEQLKKSNSKQQAKKSAAEQSTETAKKPDKGKKPRAAAKEPREEQKSSSPAPPPVMEPGSALDGVPLEELPERRKGPGRPPKQGNVSKRDAAAAKRLRKDYEKRGEEPPSFKDLVDAVRREHKIKDMQRSGASGPLPLGTEVMESIETDPTTTPARTAGVPMPEDNDQTNAEASEPARRPSPKPRVRRSLSPMKPESECTEEELKKPPGTYVHLIDEVLRNHPTGVADLQDIYDRICKRFPYYKYRQATLGWQSSVRHNLLSNKRFIQNGKAGKGKWWSIDYDEPILTATEKKAKKNTPPRGQMSNGQYASDSMPPPQFGQPQYGNPFGPPQPNGQAAMSAGSQHGSTYYSPYAQPGQHLSFGGYAQPGAPHTSPPNRQAQFPPYTPHPNHPPRPAPQQQLNGAASASASPFGGLVEEIMKFRMDYLGQFKGKENYDMHEQIFVSTTDLLSNLFHGGQNSADIRESLDSEEQKRVFDRMDSLFRRYKPAKVENSNAGRSGSNGGEAQQIEANGDAGRPAAGERAASHDSPPRQVKGSGPRWEEDTPPPEPVPPEQVPPEPLPPRTPSGKRKAEGSDSEPDSKRRKD